MPSPFPGIDPYLESTLYCQDFHERFLPYAAEVLQPQLPHRYRARIGERVILAAVERTIIPDLTVVQRPAPRDAELQTPGHPTGMALGVDAPTIFSVLPDEFRVWRAAQPQQYEVYFVRLQERLPRLRIPLLPEGHDVALDLPAIFTRCYDAARYDLDLDYTQLPPMELSPADRIWLENWLWNKE